MTEEAITLFVTHSHHPTMNAETRFLGSLTIGAVKVWAAGEGKLTV